MGKFELEKQIQSCHVYKELLKELENYLLNQVPKLFNASTESIRKCYSISITDKLGTEEIPSISEYSPACFPNGTSKILFEVDAFGQTRLRVMVKLTKEKYLAGISIMNTAENPRDVSVGIYEGIKRIIEENKNQNWIFHLPIYALFFLLWLTAFLIGLTTPDSKPAKPFLDFVMGVSFFFMLFTLIVRKLKPYISFETKAYQKQKKWMDWFVFGSLGFIVFGSLAYALRKKLFGF